MEGEDDHQVTNVTADDCPVFDSATNNRVEMAEYWVDGVAKAALATAGIVGNIFAIIVLTKPAMRNPFNALLVSLAAVDSTYLAINLLEAVRNHFKLSTNMHVLLFPHVLYPLNHMAMTAGILLTVSIAMERYGCVHYPVEYSMALLSQPHELRRRILRYLLPVVALSVALNVNKFFDAKIAYEKVFLRGGPSAAATSNYTAVPYVDVTDLRTDPTYSAAVNWSRLFILGIVPFGLLVVLYWKIFQDIRRRRLRRQELHQHQAHYNRKAEEVAVGLAAQEDNNASVAAANGVGVALHQVPQQHKEGDHLRRAEDRQALVFMGVVVMWVLCNVPRIAFDTYEVFQIEHINACRASGFLGFPAWSRIAISFSQTLMVVNAAANLLIYCGLNRTFREELVKTATGFSSCCRTRGGDGVVVV